MMLKPYKTHLLLSAIAALCLTGPARAWDDFSSESYAHGAASYLAMPSHAHAAGLATAVTAWRDELAGFQFNPAVLDNAESPGITGSYALLSDDRKQQAADVFSPIGNYFVLGFSFATVRVGGIERRDESGMLDPVIPYFSDRENAFALSCAGRLGRTVSLGVRMRYLYQSLDRTTANGMGFDAGATYNPLPILCIGGSVLNIGSRLYWPSGHTDEVLPQGRLGVECELLKGDLKIETDLAARPDEPVDGSLCAEYTLFEIISIRCGAISSIRPSTLRRRDPVFSSGLGLRYNLFGFDYGITIPTGHIGMISHRFSIIMRLPTTNL